MVKMSLDPVQVMSGQVKELKVAPSTNGDSRGSWGEKEEFDHDHLGLTTKPKPVSLKCQHLLGSSALLRLSSAESLSQMFMLPKCSLKLSYSKCGFGGGFRQGERASDFL